MKTIKKDLKEVRESLMKELRLLHDGKVTCQRAIAKTKVTNQIIMAIRTQTKIDV